MKLKIVSPSIYPLKASGARGLTPSGRLSAWATAAKTQLTLPYL